MDTLGEKRIEPRKGQHFTLYTRHFTPLHTLTLHFTVCILHTTLQTPCSAPPHSTHHTPHSPSTLYTGHPTSRRTLNTLHFTLCASHYTVHTLNTSYTLHTPHCVLHNLHFTLCTAQRPSTLCTPHAVEMPTQNDISHLQNVTSWRKRHRHGDMIRGKSRTMSKQGSTPDPLPSLSEGYGKIWKKCEKNAKLLFWTFLDHYKLHQVALFCITCTWVAHASVSSAWQLAEQKQTITWFT